MSVAAPWAASERLSWGTVGSGVAQGTGLGSGRFARCQECVTIRAGASASRRFAGRRRAQIAPEPDLRVSAWKRWEPTTRGDPMAPCAGHVRATKLAQALAAQGNQCHTTIGNCWTP